MCDTRDAFLQGGGMTTRAFTAALLISSLAALGGASLAAGAPLGRSDAGAHGSLARLSPVHRVVQMESQHGLPRIQRQTVTVEDSAP